MQLKETQNYQKSTVIVASVINESNSQGSASLINILNTWLKQRETSYFSFDELHNSLSWIKQSIQLYTYLFFVTHFLVYHIKVHATHPKEFLYS